MLWVRHILRLFLKPEVLYGTYAFEAEKGFDGGCDYGVSMIATVKHQTSTY
jgi:hypothetical protein